jgi:drug/metabolite transporter (DMT)-like permease
VLLTDRSTPARLTAPSPRRIWAGLIVLYIAWGSTYPAMRVALRTLPPVFLLSARCTLAAIALGAICAARRAERPTGRQVWGAAVVGWLVLGLGHGLTTWSMQHTASGVAAVLGSLVPVWMALTGWAVLGQRPMRRELHGLAIGLVGLAIVASATAHGASSGKALVALAIAPAAWAAGSALSLRIATPTDPLVSTTVQLLATAPVLLLVGLVGGEQHRLPAHWSSTTVLSFTYVTVIGYVVGFAIYTWLLRAAPFTWLGTYAYVNPLLAVVLGVVLLGEPLGATTLIGSAIVLAGVALVATRTPWAAEAGAAHPVADAGAPEPARADSLPMRPLTTTRTPDPVEADA